MAFDLALWIGTQSSTAETENPTTADVTYRSLLPLVNVPIIFQVSGWKGKSYWYSQYARLLIPLTLSLTSKQQSRN